MTCLAFVSPAWALFGFSAGSIKGAETKIALQQQSFVTLRRLKAGSALFAAGGTGHGGATPSIHQHSFSTL